MALNGGIRLAVHCIVFVFFSVPVVHTTMFLFVFLFPQSLSLSLSFHPRRLRSVCHRLARTVPVSQQLPRTKKQAFKKSTFRALRSPAAFRHSIKENQGEGPLSTPLSVPWLAPSHREDKNVVSPVFTATSDQKYY